MVPCDAATTPRAPYRVSVIAFYELVSGLFFITLYLISQNKINGQFFILKPGDWLFLSILASVCTAYAFIAGVHVMRHLSPYTVMLTINLEPVYGILFAFFIFGEKERMSPKFYLGALIILLTVIVNGILKNTLKKKKPTITSKDIYLKK